MTTPSGMQTKLLAVLVSWACAYERTFLHSHVEIDEHGQPSASAAALHDGSSVAGGESVAGGDGVMRFSRGGRRASVVVEPGANATTTSDAKSDSAANKSHSAANASTEKKSIVNASNLFNESSQGKVAAKQAPSTVECGVVYRSEDIMDGQRCSSQCPYFAEDVRKSVDCHFKCVKADACGSNASGTNLLQHIPVLSAGFCQSCSVTGCKTCKHGKNECKECKT